MTDPRKPLRNKGFGDDLTASHQPARHSGMANTTATQVQPVVLDEDIRAIIKTGSLTDVLTALEPKSGTEVAEVTESLPVAITTDQREAIEALPSVYGKVVPTTKRALEPAEVDSLAVEREAIDTIEKMMEKRKASIREAVVNAIDLLGAEGEVDGNGHTLVAGDLDIPSLAKHFSWEIRETAASLDIEALKALDADGDIDHDLFLDMTTQVRVIDEAKVMACLQTNPEATLAALRAATKPGKKVGALYIRKDK